MTELRIPLDIPELDAINAMLLTLLQRTDTMMASAQQVLEQFHQLRDDVLARLDAVDNVIEGLRDQIVQGQADAASLDQLSSELDQARQRLSGFDAEDPSGDDPTPPAAA